MDTDLLAELHLSGGYAAPMTLRLAARLLAWERVCTRRGYQAYITRPVAERAKKSAFGIYGGSMLRNVEDGAMLRVRW